MNKCQKEFQKEKLDESSGRILKRIPEGISEEISQGNLGETYDEVPGVIPEGIPVEINA